MGITSLGLRKRYIKNLWVRWGVFEVVLFCYGQSRAQLSEIAHAHPAKIIR